MKTENGMKLRTAIEKPNLELVKIEDAKSRLENYEEYLCVVISVDDETPIPYYDEGLVYMKYHKAQNTFVDQNDNEWEFNEILYVYLPLNSSN